uniref:hypothetical protein n=1 Tax=Streptomyces chartreusis TaxID=1969 RepID=UPI003F4975B2
MPASTLLRWNAPQPAAVLDWQRRQEVFTRTNLTHLYLTQTIAAGSWTLMPTPTRLTPGIDTADFAARVLMLSESQRLTEARTYSIGPNTTGLAVATASGSAPRERICASRAPSPAGLMIFADPIGSDIGRFVTAQGQDVEVHTPIVAVSWSMWDQEHSQVLGDACPLTWVRRSSERGFIPLPPELTGIWMTFYSARIADTPTIAPDSVAAVSPYGEAIRADEAARADAVVQHRNPDLYGPLTWHNELIMPSGTTFDLHPKPGTAQDWASIVYTTWQIMQQTGKNQLVKITRHAPPPAARKKEKAKERQRGQRSVGDGAVRVVDLAAAQRPAKANADQDAQASDGRRKPAWSCRWPVPPYRRMTCTNPYLHHKLADDDLKHHSHREDVMPFKIKGPADKPLRVKGGTTYTFDIDAPQ